MKKGIALLITIGFIAILAALMAYMFSISNNTFESIEDIKSKSQDFILYKDIKTILDERAKSLTNSEDLTTFLLGIPSTFDKKTKLRLSVELESLSNKVNINSLLLKDKIDTSISTFLKSVCEEYNVLDATFFTNLVLDTIDEDSISRGAMSEINQEDIKFSNGRIMSKEHFDILINYYAEKSGDKNILNVPWEELVYFGPLAKSTIDCDRMSEELIKILLQSNESLTSCEEINTPTAKKFAQQYNLQAFSNQSSYYVLATIEYELEKKVSKVSFMYDIKTKEAGSIDFVN
ncbi:hypothetical protein [Sulfurospirillum arcachonense]|uniref:hypothetical protein n=1 Tax=Sulfurospirillum arcachonense TaxID=57666 RepID=UPI000468498B|nr:hypothetical protein [Sulfurospirillum arcachonense]